MAAMHSLLADGHKRIEKVYGEEKIFSRAAKAS
jgi:hypothetical protein